jgi:hypothetical protein
MTICEMNKEVLANMILYLEGAEYEDALQFVDPDRKELNMASL